MFFRSHRGRRDPHFLPIRDYEDPIRLDEARLEAWAMALGEQKRPSYRARRQMHAGMLPDVDLSRAVRRPGMIAGLVRMFAGQATGDAGQVGAAVSGTENTPLGEAERKPYVWVLDRQSDAAKPDEPDRAKDRSRAA
jgi:hypothetical protein